MKYILENLNFEVVLGFNTKQWWIFEVTNDVYIDPPKELLDEIDSKFVQGEDNEKIINYIKQEVSKKPKWLYETDFWYDGESIEI